MAKTESTAVNNLIDLVSSNQRSSKSIVHPDDDLFAAPPGPAKPITKMKTPAQALPLAKPVASAPRLAPSLPPMRGAGTVPPLPRTRAAGGTSQHTLPEHLPQLRMSTAPPTRGTTIPPIPQRLQRGSVPVFPPNGRMSQPTFTPVVAQGTPPPELISPMRAASPEVPIAPDVAKSAFAAVAPLGYPMQQRAPSPQHLSRIDMTGDAVLGENWFESSRAVEKFEDETYVGTSPHVKQDRVRESSSLVKKLILPAIGFMVVGAIIGGFIAFNGDKKQHLAAAAPGPAPMPEAPSPANTARAASIAGGTNTGVESANTAIAPVTGEQAAPPPSAPVAVEPAAAPMVAAVGSVPGTPNASIHEIQTTRGVIQLADVRIDSKPAGASVTLIDGAKKSFLGTTPLATSLDASHSYDLEISLAGRPEQTAHLDPAHTTHLSIDLAKTARAVAPAHLEAATAPRRSVAIASKPHHAAAVKVAAAVPTDEIADPGFDSTPVAAPHKNVEKPVVPTGTGTLMVSSKPPCEILIDGKATGMSTPQRAMSLPAGAHKITLVNAGANINKTVMVQINADQTTKLVKDLLPN